MIHPRRIIPGLARRFFTVVIGRHPNNTVFSFNWHNVRHLTRFFRAQSARLGDGPFHIVDVGAGSSPYFRYFETKIADYVAVDLEQSLRKGETRPIRQVPGVAEEIPLPDGQADIVLCNQALEHVIDPARAVAEIHRILRPGGVFLGSVPHISPVHLEPYDFRRFTTYGVRQLLGGAGFEEIEVEGNGGVFSAAALAINMDMVLSPHRPGRPQGFRIGRARALFPLIGLLNGTGLVLDRALGDKGRSPANLCWSARKPAP